MDEGKIQTPQEQGYEQTEQIIKILPTKGSLKPYSQVPASAAPGPRNGARGPALAYRSELLLTARFPAAANRSR